MSAEAIAKVCADLKTGRIQDILQVGYHDDLMAGIRTAEVVDATRLYHDITDRPKGVDIYAEHVMCPVWKSALIGYLNQHGNVTVMLSQCSERDDALSTLATSGLEKGLFGSWESDAPTHDIEWQRVKWVYTITVWLGGRSPLRSHIPTCGPLHMWRVAVYPDGEIADVLWIQLDTREQADPSQWDMANLVTLGSINLGNCVNVELREPARDRAQARRIARTGVRVNEIHVRPISKSYRGTRGESDTSSSVPLHSVRGHFAHYGPKYDRALLFGKYEGRYWIPQHARGVEEAGTVEHVYEMEP